MLSDAEQDWIQFWPLSVCPIPADMVYRSKLGAEKLGCQPPDSGAEPNVKECFSPQSCLGAQYPIIGPFMFPEIPFMSLSNASLLGVIFCGGWNFDNIIWMFIIGKNSKIQKSTIQYNVIYFFKTTRHYPKISPQNSHWRGLSSQSAYFSGVAILKRQTTETNHRIGYWPDGGHRGRPQPQSSSIHYWIKRGWKKHGRVGEEDNSGIAELIIVQVVNNSTELSLS